MRSWSVSAELARSREGGVASREVQVRPEDEQSRPGSLAGQKPGPSTGAAACSVEVVVRAHGAATRMQTYRVAQEQRMVPSSLGQKDRRTDRTPSSSDPCQSRPKDPRLSRMFNSRQRHGSVRACCPPEWSLLLAYRNDCLLRQVPPLVAVSSVLHLRLLR